MLISTQCEALLRRGFSLKASAKILKDAGFDCMDISFFSINKERLLANEIYKEFKELKAYGDEIGLDFNQVHAPFPSSSTDEAETETIFKTIVRSMELASILGAKHIIVHPKTHLDYRYNEETLKKINYDFYKSLEPYCEKFNIKIAIENMWGYDKNRRCITPHACALYEEHIDYIDMLKSPYFVGCLDIGHCALVGEDIVKTIGFLGHDRLKTLHVHDVNYVKDCHTLPGVELLDFDSIINALKEINYDGEFTLEADYFLSRFETEFLPDALEFMAKRARFLANKM